MKLKFLDINNKKLSWMLPWAYVIMLYLAGIIGTLMLRLDPIFYAIIAVLYIGVFALELANIVMVRDYKKAKMEDELSTGFVIIKYTTLISNMIMTVIVGMLGFMIIPFFIFLLLGMPYDWNTWFIPAVEMYSLHYLLTFALNLIYALTYLSMTSKSRPIFMNVIHAILMFIIPLDVIDTCIIMMTRGKHLISSTIVLILFTCGSMGLMFYLMLDGLTAAK